MTNQILADENKFLNKKDSEINKLSPSDMGFINSYLEIFCTKDEKHLCTGLFVCNPIVWDDKSGGRDSFALEFFQDKIIIKEPPSSNTVYNLIFPEIDQNLTNSKNYVEKSFGNIIHLQARDKTFYNIKNINTLYLTKVMFGDSGGVLPIGIGKSICKKLVN